MLHVQMYEINLELAREGSHPYNMVCKKIEIDGSNLRYDDSTDHCRMYCTKVREFSCFTKGE